MELPRNDFRPTITGIGVFLAFGSAMAALAGTTLIWPGTGLDRLWSLNRSAHAEHQKAGGYVGPLFWALSITLIAAAIGWFRRRVWGFRLAVAVLCAQVIGDLMNLARGDLLRGIAGVLIAGALLLYLLLSKIQTAFQ
jgi:hypothetical protein